MNAWSHDGIEGDILQEACIDPAQTDGLLIIDKKAESQTGGQVVSQYTNRLQTSAI
jgi:hypothetical protein